MIFTHCFPPRPRTRLRTRSSASSGSRPHTEHRPGRLLVECLVAMLLLQASALVVVGMARGASATTQAANGTSAALSVAVRGVEASIAQPCPADNTNGADALPLGRVWWTEHTQGRSREREVQVELTGSALIGAHNTTLAFRAARLCQ